jgi:hypothetical protein
MSAKGFWPGIWLAICFEPFVFSEQEFLFKPKEYGPYNNQITDAQYAPFTEFV